MPQQCVRLSAQIDASPETVFDFFCDHESFGKIWTGNFKRIKDSDDPGNPNGVGSVRLISNGPLNFEETQTRCERPEVIEYQVTRGSPIKNHLGRIQLIAENGGTRIDYSIEFDPKIPGTGCLIAWTIRRDWNKGIGPVAAQIARL